MSAHSSVPDSAPATSDSPAPAALELLFAQGPFLRRLARALVTDEHAADDLVQDTWTAALERLPAEGSQMRSLRGWLATVLRNRARNERRRALRRQAREERVAQPENPASDPETEGKLEAQAAVLELVRALREPYRTVIFLRYYEDLTPTQIAARLELPLKTIKTRLTRARALLRERMDARYGNRRAEWLGALAPLALARPVATSSVTSSVTLGATLLGGWMVKKLALAALVLVIVGLAVARNWPRSPQAVQRATPFEPARLLAEPSARPSDASPAKSHVLERVPLAVPSVSEPTAAAALRVAVRWPEGDPAADVGVELQYRDGETSRQEERVLRTDEQGVTQASGLPAGEVTLVSDRSQQRLTVELVAGETLAVDFLLDSGLDVVGRVVDAQGNAVPGAGIWLSGSYRRWPNARLFAEAGPDGAFSLRHLGARASLGARARGYQPSIAFAPEGLPEGARGEREVTLVLGEPGGRLRGKVQSALGEPMAGARVVAGPRGRGNVDLPDGTRGIVARPVVIHAGEDGVFDYPGDLPPGQVPVHVSAPGYPAWESEATITLGAETFIEVVLPEAARIEGRLLTESGQPVVGGRVLLAEEERGGWYHHQAPPPEATTDAEGCFALNGVPAGVGELNATPAYGVRSGREGRARARVECVAGEVTRLELVLDRGLMIAGQLVDVAGAPLVGWRVRDEPPLLARTFARTDETDEEGRFLLANVGDCAHDLSFYPPDYYGSPLAEVHEVAPATMDLQVVVDTSALPSAYVTGVLLGAGGKPPADVWLLIRRLGEDSAYFVEFDPRTGAFEHGPLQPGQHRLEVHRGGRTIYAGETFRLAAGERLDAGPIELEPGGGLEVVVVDYPTEAPLPLLVSLDRAGSSTISLTDSGDRFTAIAVPPGTWILSASQNACFLPDKRVEIRPGETTRVDWRARTKLTEVVAVCRFEDPEAEWSTLSCEVVDAEDELVYARPGVSRSRTRLSRLRFHAIGLPQGSFRVQAWTDTGLRAEQVLEVGFPPPGEHEIELVLR